MQKQLNETARHLAQGHGINVEAGPRLLSVEAAFERLGVGRTLGYRLLNPSAKYRNGLPRLRSVRLGGKRMVPEEAVAEFVAELERLQAEAEVGHGG